MFSAAKPYQSSEEHSFIPAVLAWLLWLEPLWLALLAVPILLPGLLPAQWQPFAVIGLFLFWPFHWLAARYTEHQFRLGNTALVILLAWIPVNLLTAVNSLDAWMAVGYLCIGITLFIAIINHPWLQQHHSHLGWLLLVLAGLLIVAAPPLVQWKSDFRLFYVPFYDWFQALPFDLGETIHANILGGALVQLLAISLALWLPPKVRTVHLPEPRTAANDMVTDHEEEQNKRLRIRRHTSEHWQQWGAGLIALLTAGLLLLTQSRGAYLGTGVVVLFILVWRWPRLAYGLPLLVIGSGYLVYRLGAWSIFEILGADNTFGGAEWRSEVWYAAGQALHDFPYTGIGIGNFRTVLPLLYPNNAINSEAANHAHNLLLQIGLDLGLPGVIAWVLLMAGALWQGVRTLRRPLELDQADPYESSRRHHRRLVRAVRHYNERQALTAGALAALSGVLVHGLLDAVTWGTKLAFLPWLILALVELTATDPEV